MRTCYAHLTTPELVRVAEVVHSDSQIVQELARRLAILHELLLIQTIQSTRGGR